MMKVLRDFLRVYWKEYASNNQQRRKANFLVYDEYTKKYVSADELLTPRAKDSFMEKLDKTISFPKCYLKYSFDTYDGKITNTKSKKTIIFDILLKKFINPKLDLINPGLKSLYNFKLTERNSIKEEDFRASSKHYFWGKRKAKKHTVVPLPPVHEKAQVEPQSSEVGWAGQKTIKPQTDIRPERGQPECVLGPGKDPNKPKKPPDKKKKKKNYLICGKTKEIQKEIDAAEINQEKNQQTFKNLKYDEENCFSDQKDERKKPELTKSNSDVTEKHLNGTKTKEEMYLDNLFGSTKNKTTKLLKNICQTLFSNDQSDKGLLKRKGSLHQHQNKGANKFKDDIDKTNINKNETKKVPKRPDKNKNLLEKEVGLKREQSKALSMRKQCSNSNVLPNNKCVKTTKDYLCKDKTDKLNTENKLIKAKNSCPPENDDKKNEIKLELTSKSQVKSNDKRNENDNHAKQNDCNTNLKDSNLKPVKKDCKNYISKRPSTSFKETTFCSKPKEDSNNMCRNPSYNFMVRPKTAYLLKSSFTETLMTEIAASKKDCNSKPNKKQITKLDDSKKFDFKRSVFEQSTGEDRCDKTSSQEVNTSMKSDNGSRKNYHSKDLLSKINSPSKNAHEKFPNRQIEAQEKCSTLHETTKVTCKNVKVEKLSLDRSKDVDKQKPPDCSKCCQIDPETTEKLQLITQEKYFEKTKLSTDLSKCSTYLGFKVKQSSLVREPIKEKDVTNNKSEDKKPPSDKVDCTKKAKSKTNVKSLNKITTESESSSCKNLGNSKNNSLLNLKPKKECLNETLQTNKLQTKPTCMSSKSISSLKTKQICNSSATEGSQDRKKEIAKGNSSVHTNENQKCKSNAIDTKNKKSREKSIVNDIESLASLEKKTKKVTKKTSKIHTVNQESKVEKGILNDTSIEKNCCKQFFIQSVSNQNEQVCCEKSEKEHDENVLDVNSPNKLCESTPKEKKQCPEVKEDTEDHKKNTQSNKCKESSMNKKKKKDITKDFITGSAKRKKSKLCKKTFQTFNSPGQLNNGEKSKMKSIPKNKLQKEEKTIKKSKRCKSAEPKKKEHLKDASKRSKSANICSENEFNKATIKAKNKSKSEKTLSTKSSKIKVSKKNQTKLDIPPSQKRDSSKKLQKLARKARCQQKSENDKKNTSSIALICSKTKLKMKKIDQKESKSLEKFDPARKKSLTENKSEIVSNQTMASKGEAKHSKICSLHSLQKRMTENPIKSSKTINTKSFSDLKQINNKPKCSIFNLTLSDSKFAHQLNMKPSKLGADDSKKSAGKSSRGKNIELSSNLLSPTLKKSLQKLKNNKHLELLPNSFANKIVNRVQESKDNTNLGVNWIKSDITISRKNDIKEYNNYNEIKTKKGTSKLNKKTSSPSAINNSQQCCIENKSLNNQKSRVKDEKEIIHSSTKNKSNNNVYTKNSFRINTFILNKSVDSPFKDAKKTTFEKKVTPNQSAKNDTSLHTKSGTHKVGSKYPLNASTLVETRKDSHRNLNYNKSKSFSSFSALATHERVMKYLVNPQYCYSEPNKNVEVSLVKTHLSSHNAHSEKNHYKFEKNEGIATGCKNITKNVANNTNSELVPLKKEPNTQITKDIFKTEDIDNVNKETTLKNNNLRKEQTSCSFNSTGVCLEKLEPKYMSKTVKHIIKNLKNLKQLKDMSEVPKEKQVKTKLLNRIHINSKFNSSTSVEFDRVAVNSLSNKEKKDMDDTKYKLETIFYRGEKMEKPINLIRNSLVNEIQESNNRNNIEPYNSRKDKRLEQFFEKGKENVTKNYKNSKTSNNFVNGACNKDVNISKNKSVSSKPSEILSKIALTKCLKNTPELDVKQGTIKNNASEDKSTTEELLKCKFSPELKSKLQLISKRHKKFLSFNKINYSPFVKVNSESNKNADVKIISKPYLSKFNQTNNTELQINCVNLTSLSAKQSRSLMEQPFYKTFKTNAPQIEVLSGSKSETNLFTLNERDSKSISRPNQHASIRSQLQKNVRVKAADLKEEIEHE